MTLSLGLSLYVNLHRILSLAPGSCLNVHRILQRTIGLTTDTVTKQTIHKILYLTATQDGQGHGGWQRARLQLRNADFKATQDGQGHLHGWIDERTHRRTDARTHARTDAQTQAQLDDCANQAVFLQEAKIAEIYVQPHVPDNASSPRAQHGKGQEQINE